MRAAVESLRKGSPREIVVAVPIGSKQTCKEFADKADALCVCAVTPEPFYGVGMWYQDFSQTTMRRFATYLPRRKKLTRIAALHDSRRCKC